MDITVLISGVADPRHSLPKELTVDALQAHLARHGTLSPFDEAALELSLSLRDADPTVRVNVLVAADEALARKVLGWRPDALHRLEFGAIPRWDTDQVTRTLAQALQELAPQTSLVLTGREFGDFDDGSVPAGLARILGMPYIALALRLQNDGGTRTALRQTLGGLERVCLPASTLLSSTNDPGNRLRHPLMKNVMMAKKATLPAWQAPAQTGEATLRLQRMAPTVDPVRRSACEWLEGSPAEKARALAKALLEDVAT